MRCLHSRDAARDILFQKCGMNSHQPAYKAKPRSRHDARRPTCRREPLFHPHKEEQPARTKRDWLGAAVLATALLIGTGLVMLIQVTPALRQALG